MKLTRRDVLAGSAATGLAALAPRFALAEIELGAGRIQTVSDGNLVLPRDFILGGLPEAEVAPILAAHGITGDQLTPPCNVTLYRDGTNVVLFDAGSGSEFMPSAGMLFDSLDAAGVSPDDVTHVVFTHAHPDHLWGLLDDFGDPAFLNAAYMIGRDEWDYWTDPATVDSIGQARTAFAVGAKRRLELIEDQITFFGDGEEILPGVAAIASYGHTPGHMSFEVGGAGDSVLVTGDAISNHHVAFAQPGWHSGSDQDPALGAETRSRLMQRLAAEKMAIAGFHLPGGGMGRVESAADGGYRFVGLDQ